ncbi:TIGR03885 family FMN-dependent LLM class oxidoreductase [Phycicoccus sp. Soil802]|uniref:TIGR03885 family FMN-dependent LLM class oxidoreductase n=1 Tax=Phycicoccus sp. Soil802 TaxID=1736414 RepID=UPI00070249A9|nr:TIGR03885 family FMN-dependent LLM class oxidoreductase [Phycicoccus sp. Soil802]KRF28264.1 LLM class F420-dependent oxidoreductase [Phycicoccus sp. Soil802]
MTRIGFHASHEQVSPRQLLADVQHAERAGFAMAMCSDHFSPWSTRQGHSGYTWSWLGAALATTELSLGCVTAPGQRYHPAVHAQRIATLGQMFPGRFWVALGSGEASNEHITGDRWPRKEVRTQRLEECVDVIRRMLAGEEVSHDGLVTVDRARLWDLPDPVPLLVGPAVSVDSAARVAAWADGLVTVNQPVETLRDVLAAYRGAGGRGRTALQVHLSWAPTEGEALAVAHDQWAGNVFGPPISWDLETAEAFDVLWGQVEPDAVRSAVRVSADLAQHRDWLAEYADLGFDDLYLHHVGQEQDAFIEAFGEHVLPALSTGS